MYNRHFADGDIIFRAGDPSEAVFLVRSGQVRLTIVESSGRTMSTVLDVGAIFGETRLLTAAPRNYEARAVGTVRLDIIPSEEVVREFDTNGGAIRPVLAGMFERERPPEPPGDGATAIPLGEDRRAAPWLRIRIADRRVDPKIGGDDITVAKLPFQVGRRPRSRSQELPDVDLCLADKRPFRMSRRHFAIEEHDGRLFIRDCGSFHGTLVNGVALGGDNPARTAPLDEGENEVVAGGAESRFRFIVTVGSV